eukprot:6815871-Prymnesium_polylepis.1
MKAPDSERSYVWCTLALSAVPSCTVIVSKPGRWPLTRAWAVALFGNDIPRAPTWTPRPKPPGVVAASGKIAYQLSPAAIKTRRLRRDENTRPQRRTLFSCTSR